MNSATNRACVVVKPLAVEIRNVSAPSVGENDVLVKVIATGICGSDTHTYTHGGVGSFKIQTPHVIGHESVGTVVEVGRLVESLVVGDRVAVEPTQFCRRCFNCKIGKTNVCKNLKHASLPPTPGTLAQYYACDSDFVLKIPDSLSWEVAACIQPLAVAVQLARRAHFSAGQTLAVFGCGPLGCLVMAVAKAHGLSKVIAFDINPERVDLARKHYADYAVVSPSQLDGQGYDDWANAFKQLALNEAGMDPSWGVDIAVEASGAEPCMHAGIAFVHSGGTYVQAGLGKDINLFPTVAIVAKELTVVGSVRTTAGCFSTAIELLVSGRVNVQALITQVFSLSQSQEALETLRKGQGMKVVIMNQEL